MKFNFFKQTKNTTVSYAGEKAYKMTPEEELYTAVVTTGLSHGFYESDDKRLVRIISLIRKCDAKFVAQLAIYTRTKMYLRSISIVLVVELAKVHSGDNLVSKTINGVIQRADEITELLAYYQIANKRSGTKKLNKMSKQVQKGVAMAFNKFDEYQFAKYNRKTEVQLKDALFLTHPKAKSDDQQKLFNKIVNDELAVPYTWEVELSKLGQESFKNDKKKRLAFKRKWEELINSNKLGYMALLRNLRNIMEADVSHGYINKVCKILSDPIRVEKSKQLPFRFLAAYREIKDISSFYTADVLDALENAVLASARNIKGFYGNTKVIVACDVSGSMQKSISQKSKIMMYDIGLMLGMLIQSRCKNVISGMFGDRWKTINMPRKSILSNVNEFYKREGEVGYSTNGYLVVKDLIDRKRSVDKVMIFTDCQMWDSNAKGATFENTWKTYKRTVAPKAKLYLFDLAGYGQMPLSIKRNDVYLIAGWSDKIFDILSAIERGSSAIGEIKTIEI